MIYSVTQKKEIPVKITKEVHYIDEKFGDLIRYNVYDNSHPSRNIYAGYVDLQDTKNGVNVIFIKNQNPDLYRHFGQVAAFFIISICPP